MAGGIKTAVCLPGTWFGGGRGVAAGQTKHLAFYNVLAHEFRDFLVHLQILLRVREVALALCEILLFLGHSRLHFGMRIMRFAEQLSYTG